MGTAPSPKSDFHVHNNNGQLILVIYTCLLYYYYKKDMDVSIVIWRTVTGSYFCLDVYTVLLKERGGVTVVNVWKGSIMSVVSVYVIMNKGFTEFRFSE